MSFVSLCIRVELVERHVSIALLMILAPSIPLAFVAHQAKDNSRVGHLPN